MHLTGKAAALLKPNRSVKSKMLLTDLFKILPSQHRTVGECDGIAAEVYRAVVCEARHRAVAGEVPHTALADRDHRAVRDRCAALCVRCDIDRSGKDRAVFERKVERRYAVNDNVSH